MSGSMFRTRTRLFTLLMRAASWSGAASGRTSRRRLLRNRLLIDMVDNYAATACQIAAIKARFEAFAPVLDERGRRLFAASEARAAERGEAAAGLARSGDLGPGSRRGAGIRVDLEHGSPSSRDSAHQALEAI